MTDKQFEKEINRFLRRIELLREVQRGDAKLKRVPVKGHWVKRHHVDGYDRYIRDVRYGKRAA